MSEDLENVKNSINSKTSSNNPGFRTALYINLPSYENGEKSSMKETIDGIENLKLGSSEFLPTPTITPRVSDTYKNYISSDLLKRLEESSPIKSQKSMEFKRKFSDISLLNVENRNEDGGENLNSPREKNKVNLVLNHRESNLNRVQKLEEESKRDYKDDNNSNDNVMSNISNNFKTRNFKLKTHIMNNKVVIDEEEEQENYEHLSRENVNENNQNNFNQNNNVNNNYDLYNSNVNNQQRENNFEEPQSLFMNSMNFNFNNNQNMNNYNMNHINNQNINFMPNNSNSKKNSLKSNNNNNLNTSQNYFSPPYQTKQAKHVRKDSSPLYTYYDGTAECLSQTFYDEFKKSNNEKFMSKNNFIKKTENTNSGNMNNNMGNINNLQQNLNNLNIQQDDPSLLSSGSLLSSNTGSNIYSKATEDQSSFNSFQLPQNYFNNGRFLNINNFGQNFGQNMNNINTNNVNNNNMSSNNMSNSMSGNSGMRTNGTSYFNNNNFGNLPHIFGNDSNLMDFSNSNLERESSMNQMNFMNSSGGMSQVQRNNMRPGTFPSNQMTPNNGSSSISLDGQDDYTVEMFGRKGWICEMCNNFNYETRQKCNRCSMIKSPKKIKGKQMSQKVPGSDMKLGGLGDNNELDDSMENKKKKPFVERVGDWVCIKCKNLNFSFRVVCNRCQLPKTESDKMFESYMSNLMNYVKVNEIMQQNILQGGQTGQTSEGSTGINPRTQMREGSSNIPGTNGYVNNNSISINNNYYNNYPNTKTQNYMQGLKGNQEFGYNNNGNFSGSSMSMSSVGNNNVMSNSGIMGIPFQMGNNNVEEDEDYYNENEEN